MLDDSDFDGLTPDGVDKFAKTGGILPADRYHVRVDGVRDAHANSGTTGETLTLTVVGGKFAGSEIEETVWDSDKPKGKQRKMLFASRLGLVTVRDGKYQRVEGKQSFADCIGAEAIVEVEHEERVGKNEKKYVNARLTFAGIWSVNDPAVKSVVKGKPGSMPAAPKAVDTAAL